MEKILLGFEVGSGKPVHMRLHHTVVVGMTQLSGKTTTLEAIISRSGLKAIAFITKRGESGFSKFHFIPPFYIERSDWAYVLSLLEAATREKMKFERAWIIRASKNTKRLREVLENVQALKKKARPDSLSENVYTVLEEYLKMIVPQIEQFSFSSSLDLQEGINVMDLSTMSLEMRSLVIRAVMEHAIQNMDGVIIIVPEAWEYLPQGRNTPVKWYAETFIRKGAAVHDFLFVDTQDLAGIDKAPLRQCDNWILGRQKESHEIDRFRDHIGKHLVSDEEIKSLALGHFYAYLGDVIKKIYVLPADVPENVGVKVAMGELTSEYVKEHFMVKKMDEDEEMYKQRFEDLKEKFDEEVERASNIKAEEKLEEFGKERVQAVIEEAAKQILEIKKQHAEQIKKLKDELAKADELIEKLHHTDEEIKAMEEIKAAFTKLLPTSAPAPMLPAVEGKPIDLEHIEQPISLSHSEQPVKMDTGTDEGKILYAILNLDMTYPKPEGEALGYDLNTIGAEMQEHGWNLGKVMRFVVGSMIKKGILVSQKTRPIKYRLPKYRIIEVEKIGK